MLFWCDRTWKGLGRLVHLRKTVVQKMYIMILLKIVSYLQEMFKDDPYCFVIGS